MSQDNFFLRCQKEFKLNKTTLQATTRTAHFLRFKNYLETKKIYLKGIDAQKLKKKSLINLNL